MAFGHEQLDIYRAAIECAAAQDVLEVRGVLSPEENTEARRLFDRIVAMHTRLGQWGCPVQKEPDEYRIEDVDTDADSDTDSE